MGLCSSKPSYISSTAGGEREYQERFLESKTLGQGEFGIVKLVHDVKNKDLIGSKPLAVKYLRKGFTFRDNTIYTPMKREVLQHEVEILQRLNGECFNLKLVAVYESTSMIYMVTEYCEGGEMVPWVSKAFQDTSGLRTEDVSRICYQLWSAVDHCARHKVIHRDIKPENVMFSSPAKDSQLRLIDFGSGTLEGLDNTETTERSGPDASGSDVERHHTFAGSAFYISPEMFQKTYTSQTDVWSAGATLYVLVAGYPADKLQETFNILQSSKAGRLRKLPNMPDNMPESFYEMLEGSMVYRHKQRMSAGQLMKGEFPQFHMHHKDEKPGTISIHEIAAEAARESGDRVPEMASGSGISTRTKSVLLEGSVSRHNAYLGYQKFERSVTTVLATMLSKDVCKNLLLVLREQNQKGEEKGMDTSLRRGESSEKKEDDKTEALKADAKLGSSSSSRKANAEKLQVVTIKVLLEVLGAMEVKDEREVKEVIAMVQALNNFKLYENFAYHISLLRQFVSLHAQNNQNDEGGGNPSSVHGNNVWNSLKKKRGLGASGHGGSGHGGSRHGGGDPDPSNHSIQSTGRIRRVSTSTSPFI